MKQHRNVLLLCALAMICLDCGQSNPNCQLTGLAVSPASGNADHTVAAPGNQVQFFAGAAAPKGCAVAACVNCWNQSWTVSDPLNVSISNNASDNGTATCLGPTTGAVTVTATAPVTGTSRTVTGTATLNCK